MMPKKQAPSPSSFYFDRPVPGWENYGVTDVVGFLG